MIRILLAKDDALMREYLKRALERTGYAVDAADSDTSAMPMPERENTICCSPIS